MSSENFSSIGKPSNSQWQIDFPKLWLFIWKFKFCPWQQIRSSFFPWCDKAHFVHFGENACPCPSLNNHCLSVILWSKNGVPWKSRSFSPQFKSSSNGFCSQQPLCFLHRKHFMGTSHFVTQNIKKTSAQSHNVMQLIILTASSRAFVSEASPPNPPFF